MKRTVLSFWILVSLVPSLTVSAAHWPSWRGGVDGSGITAENLPTQWSTTQNVKWHVALPEPGNSTPVIWGDRVFVTQPLAKEKKRTLMCFSRKDGSLLWQKGIDYAAPERTHNANPYCSASPATDGKYVVVTYGSAGTFCYDVDGKEIWRRDFGKQDHVWGYSTSPVIHGGLCFIYRGPDKSAELMALDLKTGKTAWSFKEPAWETGDRVDGFRGKSDGVIGSFSTPIIVKAGGREELVMSFPQQMIAFEPRTGKKLWWCDGLNPLVYTSPIESKGIVVAMGGYFGNSIAVKAGGNGDVTPKRLWQHVRGKGGIGTGVIKDGYIYYFATGNIATCLELETGNVVWAERLKVPGAKSDTWSSMLLAGDLIYMPNQSGDVAILKASPKFEQIGANTVGEMSNSSLAVADGEIIFRTHKGLWCFKDIKRTAGK